MKRRRTIFFLNNLIPSHRSKVKRRGTRSWSFLRTRLHFGSCQVIVRLHLDFYLHMFYFFGWSLTAITAKDFIPFCHERQLPTVNFQIWIILPANWNRQWTGIRSNISHNYKVTLENSHFGENSLLQCLRSIFTYLKPCFQSFSPNFQCCHFHKFVWKFSKLFVPWPWLNSIYPISPKTPTTISI